MAAITRMPCHAKKGMRVPNSNHRIEWSESCASLEGPFGLSCLAEPSSIGTLLFAEMTLASEAERRGAEGSAPQLAGGVHLFGSLAVILAARCRIERCRVR